MNPSVGEYGNRLHEGAGARLQATARSGAARH